MKITFKQGSKSPNDIKLYLDNKDITNSVRSFKFNASPNAISTVVLDIFPSEIEIESESFKLTTDDFSFDDMLSAFTDEAVKYAKNILKYNFHDSMVEKINDRIHSEVLKKDKE